MFTLLSTELVDYVEEPMKYQALRPHVFSMVGWVEEWGWCGGVGGDVVGLGWWGGGVVVYGWVWFFGWLCGMGGGGVDGGVGLVGWGWSNLILWTGMEN